MGAASSGRRKAYEGRARVTRTTSRRFRSGTRRNKRLKATGTFASDRRGNIIGTGVTP